MKTRKIINYKDIAYYGTYGTTVNNEEKTIYLNESDIAITGNAGQKYSLMISCDQTTELSFYDSSTLVETLTFEQGTHYVENTLLDDITKVTLDNDVKFGFLTLLRESNSVFVDDSDTHANFSYNLESVRESLQQRLSVIKGEIEFDTQYGVPLFDKLSKVDIDFAVISIISETQHVQEITSFKSWVNVREYEAEFTALTDYGELTISF